MNNIRIMILQLMQASAQGINTHHFGQSVTETEKSELKSILLEVGLKLISTKDDSGYESFHIEDV